jgi:hypothetical protein
MRTITPTGAKRRLRVEAAPFERIFIVITFLWSHVERLRLPISDRRQMPLSGSPARTKTKVAIARRPQMLHACEPH